jgi:beta-mannosidase
MKTNSILQTSLVSFIFFLLISCEQNKNQSIPSMIELKNNWQFSRVGDDRWHTAEVPGSVHTDLLRHGLIEDFFVGLNESAVQWIENESWEYKTTFRVRSSLLKRNNVELHLTGLDTYADVYLNDNLVLRADNMFVGWKVDCREFLKEGENELRIFFHSPVEEGMKKLTRLDYRVPAINEQAPIDKRSSVFTRKAPFHYGWDWGPRLVTSGVWRPVYLKAWDDALIDGVYLETVSIKENQARIIAQMEIQSVTAGDFTVSLDINGEPSGITKSVTLERGLNKKKLDIIIDDPRLWWTRGLGEPYLYDFSFMLEQDGELTDNFQVDYGVRTVRLVQNPDEVGHTFYFEVNGVPVFMKGANIIPSETITPRVTAEVYQNLIKNAVDANMNMLRVWGGAIYKDDYFYELCDRNGLLVWQDFMFACNLQPGDEAHLENIKKEAEYNVRRLRNFASIALWCGNNENLHGWHHWGWQDLYDDEQREFMWNTYQKIFYEILPAAVRKYDPKNTYWSSSPSAGNNQLADRRSGDEHDWTIWFGRQPFSNFGNGVPRFVSEWGLQAFPDMSTIAAFASEDDLNLGSEVMRKRQRSNMPYIEEGFNGNDMIGWYMEMYYDVPDDFGDFVYVSQLLQAKGYKTAVEAHRRAMPHCMGTLYWQLNDCWPTMSWATVDYYNRWKASHYAIKKAYEDIIVSSVIEGDNVNTYAVSDRLGPVEAIIGLTLMDYNGNILWSDSINAVVAANTSTLVHSIKESSLPAGDRAGSVVLVADVIAGEEIIATNNLYFASPKYLELPDASVQLGYSRNRDGYIVELVSDRLIRNLYLQTADPDAVYSDNYFDLIPGRKKLVKINTTGQIVKDDDITMLSLNDLKHGR